MRVVELFETNFPEDDPRDVAILQDMLTRADQNKVRQWATQNDWDDDEDFMHVFGYWLRDEHGITVSNGMVEFYRLWHRDTERLIGENPVLLYHFTSSARVAAIRKHGLVSGKRSVNRTQTEGVYLTTEASGPAITGYIHNALRGTTKAYGVRIDVRTYLREVQPDPDDEDISSGATQFITDYVAPSQIIGIERA